MWSTEINEVNVLVPVRANSRNKVRYVFAGKASRWNVNNEISWLSFDLKKFEIKNNAKINNIGYPERMVELKKFKHFVVDLTRYYEMHPKRARYYSNPFDAWQLDALDIEVIRGLVELEVKKNWDNV